MQNTKSTLVRSSLAQSVARQAVNLQVVGSNPTGGDFFPFSNHFLFFAKVIKNWEGEMAERSKAPGLGPYSSTAWYEYAHSGPQNVSTFWKRKPSTFWNSRGLIAVFQNVLGFRFQNVLGFQKNKDFQNVLAFWFQNVLAFF